MATTIANLAIFFTEFVGATEYPSNATNYTEVTGNEGCYSDTDLPAKTAVITSKHVTMYNISFK